MKVSTLKLTPLDLAAHLRHTATQLAAHAHLPGTAVEKPDRAYRAGDIDAVAEASSADLLALGESLTDTYRSLSDQQAEHLKTAVLSMRALRTLSTPSGFLDTLTAPSRCGATLCWVLVRPGVPWMEQGPLSTFPGLRTPQTRGL